MSIDDQKEHLTKLIELVREVIEKDNALRNEFEVGEKFRFIRDRLHALLEKLEKSLVKLQNETKEKKKESFSEDTLVYVYLYNSQGLLLKSWLNMLTPKVFYEYSVNRPIYKEKKLVDAYLRSKSNKQQHAYLTVAVKESDILESPEGSSSKDSIGNPLIKVREGSLSFQNLVSFTYNDHDYIVNDKGELVRKNP